MHRTRPLALAAALAALAGLAAPAAATDVKGSGTVTYAVTLMSRTDLPGGRSVRLSHLKGLILADQDNSPLNLSPQDCFSAAVVDDQGQMVEDHGSCVAVDVDGDVWWLAFEGDSDGSNWTVTGGTGKYDGMTSGGTTESLRATADGRFAITWEGTLQTK